MASTSATRASGGAATRIRGAATSINSENQSLIGEIRRGMNIMKDIAVDLEGDNRSDLVVRVDLRVKELEAGYIQLLEASEDFIHLSSAIEYLGNGYEPGEKPTDFTKLFDDEIAKLKASSSFDPQKDPLFRQFTTAIWNVHHDGQPMPGEEQEDIVVTSTQCNLLNTTCPISGKPITALLDPVRSMDCKHIYDKQAIMQFIRSKKGNAKCPITGCPKTLLEGRVVCDALLRIEIDELQAMSMQTAQTNIVEDFTDINEEEEESD